MLKKNLNLLNLNILNKFLFRSKMTTTKEKLLSLNYEAAKKEYPTNKITIVGIGLFFLLLFIENIIKM
jgi:hypothetical protein